jgi:putative flippase GtrA
MHELLSKLVRYMITGGIAAIVDVGVFWLLVSGNLSLASASVISFCVAAVVNYRLTSKHVFSHNANIHGFMLFVLAALIGLTVNVGVTLAAAFYIRLPFVIAKLVGIGTAFLVNFALNVRMVFQAKE